MNCCWILLLLLCCSRNGNGICGFGGGCGQYDNDDCGRPDTGCGCEPEPPKPPCCHREPEPRPCECDDPRFEPRFEPRPFGGNGATCGCEEK